MRPVTVRLSAAGVSSWIQLNRLQWLTNVGLAVKLSSGAVLTYSVEHTFDNIHDITENFTLSRVTTTATLTQTNHGLSVDDWIMVEGAGAPFDGEFAVVTVADANTLTYTVANSGVTTGARTARLHKARVFPHAVLAAQTVSADSNYAFPCFACRLNVTAYTGGFADFTVLQGN